MAGKQVKIGELKKTPLNLIQHEFYSRFPQAQKGVVHQPHCKAYYELREIQTDNGVYEKLIQTDYPITEDYVKSFVGSADYRSDINQAINAPARGINLGDMTSLQELCSMDLTAVQELKAKLSVVEQEKIKQAEKTVANTAEPVNTNQGDINNG